MRALHVVDDSPTQETKRSELETGVRAAAAVAVEPPQRYLFVIDGESGRMVPLASEGQLTVGRGEAADIKLTDGAVSRLHVRLTFGAAGVRLDDLGSQNGTLVNDERVRGSSPLASGDVITVCGATLIYHSTGSDGPLERLVDVPTFRRRTEVELERAVKYFRPVSLLSVRVAPAAARDLVEQALEAQLRTVDSAAWLQPDGFAVLLPEADSKLTRELALKVIEAVGPHAELKGGIATCPGDGIDAESLLASAKEAALTARPLEVVSAERAYRSLQLGDTNVVVADPVMARLHALIERLARSELPVLVCGETGTGKELAARALHHHSTRASQPLVTVNCAALQETLLESELFGHEKGAFTGADRAKQGLLEAASGGTIFFDELGELSLAIQAKLLRAIEARRIIRVGDTRERPVDIRIVAATNKNLEDEVRAGRFRQDLYFRLNGAVLWLPPLRDRKRELPILARAFLAEACRRLGRESQHLSDSAMQQLGLYEWPGNVRELKNVIEYAAATANEQTIEPWHLEARLAGAASRAALGTSAARWGDALRPIHEEVEELERTRMLQALHAHAWNQTRAADMIRMPLRTFVTKFRLYDLARVKPR